MKSLSFRCLSHIINHPKEDIYFSSYVDNIGSGLEAYLNSAMDCLFFENMKNIVERKLWRSLINEKS